METCVNCKYSHDNSVFNVVYCRLMHCEMPDDEYCLSWKEDEREEK